MQQDVRGGLGHLGSNQDPRGGELGNLNKIMPWSTVLLTGKDLYFFLLCLLCNSASTTSLLFSDMILAALGVRSLGA
jgi:hypothetical protein